ncbi:MAG TPA: P-loop NTPase fold protein [Candidatus Angelobacter sp.]|nr:P-loop NTPase fold protein [Candidatus Angelobacter sp.]
MSETQPSHSFTDAALTHSREDRFRRAPFAQAVARTLAALSDPGSIAIGIYGPWGDGKTTVLSFIQEELQNDDRMIAMYFNPWRFGDEEQLLQSFFALLVKQLGEKLKGAKALAHELKEIFSLIPYAGNAAEKLVGKLTVQTLEEFKDKTEKILRKGGKRIVVLMDDIDRLETSEIQAVFRLIKLTASFDYVAYVLAFDEKVVAEALQEKYGTVSQSGQGFLEKIIQVPLHLPKIPLEVLLEFCHERVQEALSAAGVELTEEEEKSFRSGFAPIAMRLGTPRQCKRYANGVTFALGILKGEVNAVDLLLIEAIRVFYPRVYEIVRSHKDVFVSGAPANASFPDPDAFDKDVLQPVLSLIDTFEREALRLLVVRLFPDFGKSGFERQKIGLYDALADNQRIASSHYFDRFFTYSVPVNDILDTDIANLLRNIVDRSIEEIAPEMQRLIARAGPSGPGAFISRLGLRRCLLDLIVSPNVARGIAANSSRFPHLYDSPGLSLYYSDAVLLVRQLVLNTPTILGERRAVMLDIVKHSESLPFAYCCLLAAADAREDQKSWVEVYGHLDGHAASSEAPIGGQDYQDVTGAMAKRIKSFFDQPSSYELEMRERSKFLAEAWRSCSPEDVRPYFDKAVEKHRERALGIVHWYVPEAADVGLFGRERYSSIAALVSPEILVNALKKKFGEALNSTEPAEKNVAIAQAFVQLHSKFGKEATASNTTNNATPSNDTPSKDATNES